MAGMVDASKCTTERDSGVPQGKMYHAACKTWCTTTGKVTPLSFKFEGDDGEIVYVPRLRILYDEEKNYSGIPSREFGCEACIGGFMKQFKLIYYLEACKWVMLV